MEDGHPSTSGVVRSPKKRSRHASLSVAEKTMVQNVFQYVFNEEEKKLDTKLCEKPNKRHCVQKTADILGIGTSTVFNILKDIKENVKPTPPQRSGPKLTFIDKLDEFTLSAIHSTEPFNIHGPTCTCPIYIRY
ncbi:hypothetical protein K1T71_013089 [Dendrolimus kikuchii]|uniref:Uncharacterized protein n=1 Tax=Dendrolimus kikuchii TaxID=765133 RepID=A0ACC1CIY1_9NEOP|nr:hypothetical protein K1T71_013089 [Dendrolimus kikuchii]